MKIAIETGRLPILLVTFPRSFDSEELRAHFDRVTAIGLRSPLFTVIDVSAVRVSGVTAAHRQAAAEGYARFMAAIPKGTLLGEAFVLTSAMARGSLTAVRWLAPPTWPHRNFAKTADAIAWAEEVVRAAGLREQLASTTAP